MKILSTDIGGTYTRFASFQVDDLSRVVMREACRFPTAHPSIRSFADLLDYFHRNAPDGMGGADDHDAVSVAVAGAVEGRTATLTNIAWNIDLGRFRPHGATFLLNDFFAQAHSFLAPGALDDLEEIRAGASNRSGSIAVVGAGTGLGHCLLHPSPARGGHSVLSSEAGHAVFAFGGTEESRVRDFMLERTGEPYLNNDDVVSGSGLAMLHECLTGRAAEPAAALAPEGRASATNDLFARFYARACRNYCLATFPTRALIVSGGIAAKNPHIVHSKAFIDEFDNGRNYRTLLERIPIYLNRDQDTGIRGAAIHAYLSLSSTV